MSAIDLFNTRSAVLEYRPVRRADGGVLWYWVLLPLPSEDVALATGSADSKGMASVAGRQFAHRLRRRVTKVRTFGLDQPVLESGRPEQILEATDPDDFDPERYLSTALEWEQALIRHGFKPSPTRAHGYEKISRGRLRLVSIGPSTTQGSAIVATYYNSHGRWKHINLEVVPFVNVVAHAKAILNEAADPDAFDPNAYIDRVGGSAQDEVEKWLRLAGFRRTHQQRDQRRAVTYQKRIGYRFMSITRTLDSVGGDFDPIWAVSHFHPHMKHAGVRQSNLREFIGRLLVGDTEVFGDVRLVTESADPDDPKAFVGRLENPEHVLREYGFRKHTQEAWVCEDGGVSIVVEHDPNPLATNWRVKSWIFGEKHDAVKEFDWFDLRKGIEWALSRSPTHRWQQVRESADPDDIDPQRYFGTMLWVIVLLSRVPHTERHRYYKARLHSSGSFAGGDWMVKERDATHWRSRAWAEAFAEKNLNPWYVSQIEIRPAQRVVESADPDDINPQRYLDAVAATAGPLALHARLEAAFRGSFMQPEYYYSDFHSVETREGTFIVPSDVVDSEDPGDYADYVEGEITEISERREGWVYRTSASGYMDASEWDAADSEEEAIEALIDNYGDSEARLGDDDELEESAGPDDIDPALYLSAVPMQVEAVFTVSYEDADDVLAELHVDARAYLESRSKRWLHNLRVHASLMPAGHPTVGVDFEYIEPDLAAMSTLRLPDEFYAYMHHWECGGVLEIDRDALERWWAARHVDRLKKLKESSDPDDIDPKKWLDHVALSNERVREVLGRIPEYFHLGFSIYTSNEGTIEDCARENGNGIVLDDAAWNTLNEDTAKIERNVLRWLNTEIGARSEGHNGEGDLVGSVFVYLDNPVHYEFFEDYLRHEEPWNTGSGTFPNEANVYEGTSELAHLIDASLDLFDYKKCQAAFEGLEDEGVTLERVKAAWTGVSPPREVDEAADPDEPDMARWVERLSVEALLDRLFGAKGMPVSRDFPRAAAQWEKVYQFGLVKADVIYKLFYTGPGAPSALLDCAVKQGRKKQHEETLVYGPDTILRQVELLVREIEGLETAFPKTFNDVVLALRRPVNVQCSFDERTNCCDNS